MERRYAQERLGGSCRARVAGTAANRVRGVIITIVVVDRFGFNPVG